MAYFVDSLVRYTVGWCKGSDLRHIRCYRFFHVGGRSARSDILYGTLVSSVTDVNNVAEEVVQPEFLCCE